jgi:glycine cleavage system transcriptional repressor
MESTMEKAIISLVGKDRPGIIAAASKLLFRQGCNIENVSQTILQSMFAGMFIVSIPSQSSIENLCDSLEAGLSPMDLDVQAKPLSTETLDAGMGRCEPFVITTIGPDRKGLVAAVTEVLARYQVNVTNLQAVFEGGDDPTGNIMIYEVDVPDETDQAQLSEDLKKRAQQLGLDISIQHRRIFEAINRI